MADNRSFARRETVGLDHDRDIFRFARIAIHDVTLCRFRFSENLEFCGRHIATMKDVLAENF